jgi:hypothetical protein
MSSMLPVDLADTNLMAAPTIKSGLVSRAAEKPRKSVPYNASFRREILALTGVVILALLSVMGARAWDIHPGQVPTDIWIVSP